MTRNQPRNAGITNVSEPTYLGPGDDLNDVAMTEVA